MQIANVFCLHPMQHCLEAAICQSEVQIHSENRPCFSTQNTRRRTGAIGSHSSLGRSVRWLDSPVQVAIQIIFWFVIASDAALVGRFHLPMGGAKAGCGQRSYAVRWGPAIYLQGRKFILNLYFQPGAEPGQK